MKMTAHHYIFICKVTDKYYFLSGLKFDDSGSRMLCRIGMQFGDPKEIISHFFSISISHLGPSSAFLMTNRRDEIISSAFFAGLRFEGVCMWL